MFTGEYGGIGMNKTLLTILAGTIILSLIIKDGVYEK